MTPQSIGRTRTGRSVKTHDVSTTEFEWAVMRFFSAFEELSATIGHCGLSDPSFQELVLPHVVGMQHHAQPATQLRDS